MQYKDLLTQEYYIYRDQRPR